MEINLIKAFVTLLVMAYLAAICKGETTRCDKLRCQLRMAGCSLSAFSESCVPYYDALKRGECVSTADVPTAPPTTTMAPTIAPTMAPTIAPTIAPTPAPVYLCRGTVPERYCEDPTTCTDAGRHILSTLSCEDANPGYECCQGPTNGYADCEGAGSTNECILYSACTTRSGTQDQTKVCPDGPEVCCTFPGTTMAPAVTSTAGPLYPCMQNVPRRFCYDPTSCANLDGGRVLSYLSCAGSSPGFECCQSSTADFEECLASFSNECILKDTCTARSGTQDGSKFCPDGPQICCTFGNS